MNIDDYCKHERIREAGTLCVESLDVQLYRCMDPCRSFLRPLVYGGLGIPDFIKPIDIHRYKPNGDHLRLDPEESKNPMWCIAR